MKMSLGKKPNLTIDWDIRFLNKKLVYTVKILNKKTIK